MKTLKITFFIILVTVAVAFSQNTELEKEKEAVTNTAMDYIDGAHEGNAARIERAVHPELTKMSLRNIPQLKKAILLKAGYSRLVELVRANMIPLKKEKRNIKIKIYAVKEGLASVLASSALYYDYLQMAKIDGQWKIINILWTANPGEKSTPSSDEDKEAIKKTALDYIEGAYSGDPERMARAVHPELNKVIPSVLQQTGKTMLNYTSAAMLIEGTKAKLGMLEKDKRDIRVTIFDVQKEIASVEVLSARYYDYLQMAKINGQWKIINVLWKMNPAATGSK